MPLTFTADEWQSIAFSLRIAAEQYDRDRQVCAEHPAHTPLVEQFTQQAARARAFAERIELEA